MRRLAARDSPRRDLLGGIAAAVSVLVVVLLQPPLTAIENPTSSDGLRVAAQALRGDGGRADFAADYVGARAMIQRDDAYPVLGPAFADVGIDWPISDVNTHPPTTFLFAMPLAWLPWNLAFATWAWLMVGLLALSAWALGLSAPRALVMAPLLLWWPPVAWSLGQVTIVWFAAQSLAWRWRDRPALAGTAIAVATTLKFTPVLLLIPFLLTRRWRCLIGFVGYSAASAMIVAALNPSAIRDYLTIGRSASRATVERLDNGGLLLWLAHTHAAPGIVVGIALIALVVLRRPKSYEHWSWAAVACLPIAWVYSVVPLLAGMATTLRCKRFIAVAMAAIAVGYAWLSPPFGVSAAGYQVAIVVFAGLALALRPADVSEPPVGTGPDDVRAAARLEESRRAS